MNRLRTTWRNYWERRRKRQMMRQIAQRMHEIEPLVWRSLVKHAFKPGKRFRYPRSLRVSGAIQVGEGVWVAGIQREVNW